MQKTKADLGGEWGGGGGGVSSRAGCVAGGPLYMKGEGKGVKKGWPLGGGRSWGLGVLGGRGSGLGVWVGEAGGGLAEGRGGGVCRTGGVPGAGAALGWSGLGVWGGLGAGSGSGPRVQPSARAMQKAGHWANAGGNRQKRSTCTPRELQAIEHLHTVASGARQAAEADGHWLMRTRRVTGAGQERTPMQELLEGSSGCASVLWIQPTVHSHCPPFHIAWCTQRAANAAKWHSLYSHAVQRRLDLVARPVLTEGFAPSHTRFCSMIG
ncbi:hypothetical protein BDZ91DRAFT_766214 [Kalaharituber pfeilii]|nr:hypothetical protein BDZ91DRAFT_766214 [Kalaharituber pfeilii]